jgi:hypothetical protein
LIVGAALLVLFGEVAVAFVADDVTAASGAPATAFDESKCLSAR